ncbi:hypothetical protein N8G13_00005, partial [Mycoplasma zalophi]|nr:hypothetical protein [Mycoplasma zalophi]
MKKSKKILLTTLSLGSMIIIPSMLAASCVKENANNINFENINKEIKVAYKDANATKFSEVPTLLTDKNFVFSGTKDGVVVTFKEATKTKNNITVKYTLSKEKQVSKVFEQNINKDQFKVEQAGNTQSNTQPGAEKQAKPGAENQAKPGAENQAKPGAEKQAKPGAENQAKPG